MPEGTFGERLRQARKKAGITVSDLSDYLKVSKKTVYGWETDRNFPGFSTLPSLCAILGVSLDELFGIADGSFTVSEMERKIIEAYRAHPEMRKSVLRLFELEEK